MNEDDLGVDVEENAFYRRRDKPAATECQRTFTLCRWPRCDCPVDIVTNPRGPSKSAMRSR